MNINLLAVLAAALASTVLGMLWYSPFLFGGLWLKLMKTKLAKLKKPKNTGVGKTYIISFTSTLLMSYVLARIIAISKAATIAAGASTGFWLWLGFMAVVTLGGVLWEGKSPKLYILNNAYNLLSLMMMGAILAAWR